MAAVTLVTYAGWAGAADPSRIADLALCETDAGPVLYAATRYGGAITAWDVGDAGIDAIGSIGFGRADRPGAVVDFCLVETSHGPALLTGGGAAAPLTLRSLGEDGGFGGRSSLGLSPFDGDLAHSLRLDLPGGQVVYGGLVGASGIGRLGFDVTGGFTGAALTADTAATAADRVSALAAARVGGATYLVSASATEDGLTCWEVAADGALTARGGLGAEQGLWIDGASALAAAEVAGVSYMVLGAAGSGSLSVVELGPGGGLRVTDHVLDDLGSRFGGVTALEVMRWGGQSYVAAGGADDGISLYQILPGGRLLALAHLADTAGMGLANVGALAGRAGAQGLEIFVASSSEPGLTRLAYDPGPPGATLLAGATGGTRTGGAGNDVLAGAGGADRLEGGAGDDVLMDGAGEDRLTGGAGADVFVLAADGVRDVIADFSLGSDRLDLSGWGLLRDVDQLVLTPTAEGLEIGFGVERLLLVAADRRPIDPARLTEADILNLTRLPLRLDLPPPGPDPDPGQPPAPFNGTAAAERVIGSGLGESMAGNGGDDSLIGNGGADTLSGGAGRDRLEGGTGDDLLSGGADADSLAGGEGDDRLSGDGADDLLEGGAGDDLLSGGEGADSLAGGEGGDNLWGGEGDDWLEGGTGDDRLEGEAGDDRLFGGEGNDQLSGSAGTDLLAGEAGDDMLSGGDGVDSLAGGEGRDSLLGGEGDDWLEGGAGDDRLEGEAGDDRLLGGEGADLLFGGEGADRIGGEAGRDRLYGGLGDDRLEAGAEDDSLWGGSGADRMEGAGGSDRLEGGTGDDRLFGGGGADLLFGGAGRDSLFGGPGDDRLQGGSGSDRLSGGSGADVFVFRTRGDSPAGEGRDSILQFSRGSDRIDLSAIDADSGAAGNQAFRFIGAAGFSGAAGELRCRPLQGGLLLEADLGGDGRADLQIFVDHLAGLGAGDFLL